MQMNVSGISTRDGKKVAYVLFDDGERKAEAIVPECRIIDNKGFSQIEVEQLEGYMRDNIDAIKQMAAGVNPVSALMKN